MDRPSAPVVTIRLLGDPALVGADGGVKALERRAAGLLALGALEPGVTRALRRAAVAGVRQCAPGAAPADGALQEQLRRRPAARRDALFIAEGVDVDVRAAGNPTEGGHVDGTGANARFAGFSGMAVDAAGNVYVSSGSTTIWRITPAGVATTWAGAVGSPGSADGFRTDARFFDIAGLAFDAAGNLVAASYSTIRRITPAGQVSTVAGLANAPGSADGMGSTARFTAPNRLAFDAAGQLWISDGGALPGWPLKFPHLWPGQTPPPDRGLSAR